MSSLAKQVQEYVVETLKKSSTLKSQPIVAQDSKSLLFEMKNALGKQGLILVVSTPESDWTGYLTTESQTYSGAWDVDFTVTAIENPIVNRSKQDLTGQDAAMAAADYLSKQFGKFLVKSYAQYQDGQLIANEIKATCLALEDAVESKKYTAKDYISNGLVAMWDGIENAGFGRHNNISRVWKDLAGGNFDMQLSGDVSFGNKSFDIAAGTGNYATLDVAQTTLMRSLVRGIDTTLEIVVTDPHTGTARYIAGQSDLPLFGWAHTGLNQFYGMSWVGSYGETNKTALTYNIALKRTTQSFSLHFTHTTNVNSVLAKSPIYINAKATYQNRTHYYGTVQQVLTVGNFVSNYVQPFSVHSVRIYNRPLTEDEILHNYEVDSARFDLTDMSTVVQALETPDPDKPAQVNTFQEDKKEEILTI